MGKYSLRICSPWGLITESSAAVFVGGKTNSTHSFPGFGKAANGGIESDRDQFTSSDFLPPLVGHNNVLGG